MRRLFLCLYSVRFERQALIGTAFTPRWYDVLRTVRMAEMHQSHGKSFLPRCFRYAFLFILMSRYFLEPSFSKARSSPSVRPPPFSDTVSLSLLGIFIFLCCCVQLGCCHSALRFAKKSTLFFFFCKLGPYCASFWLFGLSLELLLLQH